MSTTQRTARREFLANVGRGMVVAGVGYAAARELGLSPLSAEDAPGSERLSFGSRERLAALLEETPPERLLPLLVERLRDGTDLKELVAVAALVNARAFGGEDYVGFHTFMAMAPAYHMAAELPPERRALPVLKVLHRNATRLHEADRARGDTLRVVAAAAVATSAAEAGALAGPSPDAGSLRDAIHRRDVAAAESVFAAMARSSAGEAWNGLLETVHEGPEVHRIVLAYRAWDMLDFVGKDGAETMLRQSLRYCVRNEEHTARYFGGVKSLLPKLFDEHKLLGRAPGTRQVDDAWVERTSEAIFRSTAEEAAGMVAGAVAEGIAPEAIGEAISLAANQLVLRDSGRTERQVQPKKPLGSVHGDSIGVHACDSANAWRNIARTSDARNSIASLILSGYQVALDRVNRGGSFLEWKPRPYAERLEKVAATEPAALLSELRGAIRENDQDGACAIAHRYLALGHAPRSLLDVCLEYATSEDGALHAEKYYRTTTDEYQSTRPAFRDRQLVALARVTASTHGTPAPGYDEACRLLELG
jgi:hypothetical protein